MRNTLRAATVGAAVILSMNAVPAQEHPLPVGHGFPNGKPIDIAGFYPGMTGAQARPLLAAHYTKQVSKPHLSMSAMPFSKEAFLRLASGSRTAGDINYDNVVIIFSGPPSGNQAVLVRRSAQFLANARPNRDATLAAIREKFGEPSRLVRENTMEFYFSKGRRLTQQDGKDSQACSRGYGGVLEASRHPNDNIRMSFLRDAYKAMQSSGGQCDIFIRIDWSGSYDRVGGQSVRNDNVIGTLRMTAFDYSRFFANTNADAQAIEALQNKARKSVPTGSAAPRL